MLTRAPAILRIGAVAALTTLVLVYVGQHVWPEAIVRIDGSVTDAVRSLRRLGWFGFLVVQVIIAISGIFPASLVGILAGGAYGVTRGFTMASISTLIGAVVAFLLSRSLLRTVIERILRGSPRLSKLDGQIGNQGWRLVCLLRLSPVMPFAATSYALGLSSITLGEYLVGTLVALPSLLGYVLAGVLLKTGVSAWGPGEDSIRLASMAIGTLSIATLIIQVAHMLRHAIQRPETTI